MGMRLGSLAVTAASWLVAGCSGGRSAADGADGTDGTGAARADSVGAPPPVLIAAGDIASCESNGDEATARLLDSLPGTVLALGDIAYRHGSAREFRACYAPSWGRHRARTRPVPGNHEYYVRDAADYFAYFGAAAGPRGRGYYSFDVGEWHIVALNSNIDVRPGSPQERWLRADLAANERRRCTLAFFHHARFSSGGDHGPVASVDPLWQALYEAGADLILQAHDHLYERLAPLAPDGRSDPERGIRSFVVGTGGASTDLFGRPIHGSEARYNGGPGVLKLTLGVDGYAWEFIAVGAAGFTDRGEGRCH
jgi:calcineurin-like phosphoesterase family protein